MTPRPTNPFTLVDSHFTLTDWAAPQGGVPLSSVYLVVTLGDGRFIVLPSGALGELVSRMLPEMPDRTLRDRLMHAPLAELFGVLAGNGVTAGARPGTTSRVVTAHGAVVDVLPAERHETVQMLIDAIMRSPVYPQGQSQAAEPPQSEGDLEEVAETAEVARPPAPAIPGDSLDVPSGGGESSGHGGHSGRGESKTESPGAVEPHSPHREDIRLDTAAPERIAVDQSFDLAVAVRQPSSLPLALEDLPKLASTTGSVYRAGGRVIKYRVEVEAKDCDVEPPSYLFYLEAGKDSIVHYFQLTPKREGTLTVIVNAYQADDSALAASTRIRLQASLVVGNASVPAGHDIALKAYAVIQRLFTLDDLRDVAYRVGANWDELGGDTLSVKAQSLLAYCGNRNLMTAVCDAINQVRPEAGLKL